MENTTAHEAMALTGRQQAFAFIAAKCTYAQAVCLKEIHDTKAYEPLGLTWEDYCHQHAGIGRTTAETIIKRLEEFGEAYFRLSILVRISDDAFRQIQERVTAQTIELDGESIPLTAGNAAKIRAGIRRLQEEARRLNNAYRVPTRVTEWSIRIDDATKAIVGRARLGRALPNEEAASLRSLARHVVTQWSEIVEMLRSPTEE